MDRPRAPTPRKRPIEDEEERDPEERRADGEARKGWVRRHPIAVAFGLLCLLLALPAGYLYWDYTSHFETTDDAYIASRQFG
ncbi:MAG: HlyD family secretion protein, partial [Alphaproteobacteria bacterium]|nr:HlyD family secretion protein [Alphaproteobacteria bacterium]